MLLLLQGGPPAQPGQVRPQDQERDLRQRQRRVRVPQGGERHRQAAPLPAAAAGRAAAPRPAAAGAPRSCVRAADRHRGQGVQPDLLEPGRVAAARGVVVQLRGARHAPARPLHGGHQPGHAHQRRAEPRAQEGGRRHQLPLHSLEQSHGRGRGRHDGGRDQHRRQL